MCVYIYVCIYTHAHTERFRNTTAAKLLLSIQAAAIRLHEAKVCCFRK